jgi:phytoene desaturase
MKRVSVIGAGFSGIAAASCLAKEGFNVTVFEKNSLPGGRARKFETNGFVFDMGPSWYWMPDVFERYFRLLGKQTSDYYQLERLDPSYRIYYGKDDYLDIPSGLDSLYTSFEKLEPGSSKHLKRFLEEGEFKYNLGINNLVYKPGLSLFELADVSVIKGVLKLHVFQSLSAYVRKFFKEPRIIQLLEFPMLFLGATAENTPALYSLMNYADMSLGTWYPMGGMYKVVEGMTTLAKGLGVEFLFNTPVEKFEIAKKRISGIYSGDHLHPTDLVVAGADYHHVEQQLLPRQYRLYSDNYWNGRTMAPSSLLFFIGVKKKVHGLQHHTLFFDEDFSEHSRDIYDRPKWPKAPQFYVSCRSKTDPSVAPEGCENLVILIPVAPGLDDNEETREAYFEIVMSRLERILGENIREHVVFKRSYAHNDFIRDYNAFKGNAYGLANTLLQTANFKPSMLNKKVTNLFYTGQLTVPGPGVPPALISGQVVARQVIKKTRQTVISTR